MKRLLFQVARGMSRSRGLGRLIGLTFQYFHFLLPIRNSSEEDDILVFPHPRPSFAHHCLAVPKRSIPAFQDLIDQSNLSLFLAIAREGRRIIREQSWSAYSVGVNGGAYQDVSQVHFHLYAEAEHWSPIAGSMPSGTTPICHGYSYFSHPEPARDTHIVLVPHANDGQPFFGLSEAFADIQSSIPELDDAYTVFLEYDMEGSGNPVLLHIVSGDSRGPDISNT